MTNSQRVLLNERISKLAHILARVPQGSYDLPGCLKSSSGATSNIFHPQAAKKCCNFSAANFICSPIYVELFIHAQQNAWITFEIMLESSIIKDGLKVKTSCVALLLLDDKEEVAMKKRARRSIWVKTWLQRIAELGIYSNLFQELIKAKSFRDHIRMDKMHFILQKDCIHTL